MSNSSKEQHPEDKNEITEVITVENTIEVLETKKEVRIEKAKEVENVEDFKKNEPFDF